MSKILVTGFDPFGGEPVNPAFEAVKLLPESIAGVSVVKLEIPTVFTRSAMVVEEAIEREKPDYVLCIGQAGGRSAVTVEKVAINLAEARIPDNDGEQPFDTPLREDGDTAYFATLPVKAMVKRINASGIPALMSYTAGTYVCNSIMYNVLYLLDRRFPGVKGGFIHVPYATAQGVGKPNGTPTMARLGGGGESRTGPPTMEIATMAKAIEAAIEAAVSVDEDATDIMGETH